MFILIIRDEHFGYKSQMFNLLYLKRDVQLYVGIISIFNSM